MPYLAPVTWVNLTGQETTGLGGARQMQDVSSVAQAPQSVTESWWPKGWWSIADYKIGIVPLPVFLILLG